MNKIEGIETMEISGPSYNQFSSREDRWSDDSTCALIEAWGDRHLQLNRGNLHQKDWHEVAETVNACRLSGKKARRTDIQCRNRIDTLKKKYKTERAWVLSSGGKLTSKWPFYSRLDYLIGPKEVPPGFVPIAHRKPLSKNPYASEVVAAFSAKEERTLPSVQGDFRRNYSAVAAAAAAAGDDSGLSRSRSSSESTEDEEVDGFRLLAQAVVRFGEIYERVEEMKQRELIELEKQRMEFMKDLEFERMQLFMDTQVQLEKIKRAKRAAANDNYL